jgi:hypothetical protein
MVAECWTSLPEHFSHIELDAWVVMPIHFHGIILLENDATRHAGTPEASPYQMSPNRRFGG